MNVAVTNDDTETLVLRFETARHAKLHRILVEAGFDFMVTAGLCAGRVYRLDKKQLSVRLKPVDDDLEFYMEKDGRVLVAEDYSTAEWEWMCNPNDEPLILSKELYIQTVVRPHYLTPQHMDTVFQVTRR